MRYHVYYARDLKSNEHPRPWWSGDTRVLALRCVYTCDRNAGAAVVVHPMFYLSTLCTSLQVPSSTCGQAHSDLTYWTGSIITGFLCAVGW